MWVVTGRPSVYLSSVIRKKYAVAHRCLLFHVHHLHVFHSRAVSSIPEAVAEGSELPRPGQDSPSHEGKPGEAPAAEIARPTEGEEGVPPPPEVSHAPLDHLAGSPQFGSFHLRVAGFPSPELLPFDVVGVGQQAMEVLSAWI